MVVGQLLLCTALPYVMYCRLPQLMFLALAMLLLLLLDSSADE